MADYKLDLFKILGQIDKGDSSFFDKLSDEEKKEFSPLIFMRWMSGCDDKFQLMMLNAFPNKIVFPLGKHKALLARLLVACSSKRSKRYQWINNKKQTSRQQSLTVLAKYFSVSEREAKTMLHLVQPNDIAEMANSLGYQKDEISKLQKELKNGN